MLHKFKIIGKKFIKIVVKKMKLFTLEDIKTSFQVKKKNKL